MAELDGRLKSNMMRSPGFHRARYSGRTLQLYDAVKKTIVDCTPRLHLPGPLPASIDIELCSRILFDVLKDNPLIFWCEKRIDITRSEDGCELRFHYTKDTDNRAELTEEVRQSTIGFVKDLAAMNEYEKSLTIHDRLLQRVSYGGDRTHRSHCLLGPLLDGEGVCDGISDAYSLLMNTVNVRTARIDGTFSDDRPLNHSWNISIINGSGYHVDVTNDLGGMHRFLNVNDAIMGLTHSYDRLIECDAMDCNYYSVNGTLFQDRRQAARFVRKSFEQGARSLEFFVHDGMSEKELETAIIHLNRSINCDMMMSFDSRGFLLKFSQPSKDAPLANRVVYR